MQVSIAHVTLLVREYDEAIAFYVGKLGFELIEDTYRPEQDKRWVVVAPPGSTGTSLLLARASDEAQRARVGDATGGRVALFLRTDNFERDYRRLVDAGVEFARPPVVQPYGTVAVFRDLYGTLWDLIQYSDAP
ncbi:VOC family protein [Cognatilysobacter lacus]|uniref:VOC family protein n=1 Tax=Cognatilysobacter lacus TaxID=1643323 RepID=A0A5D8YEH9_9GAMM|nr:VOC family protein [Lysobacter lacus]TZF80931.1 VOC family protein [Lysobacter lacus]